MSTKVLIPLPDSNNEYGEDVVVIYDPAKLIALANGVAAMRDAVDDLYKRAKEMPIPCLLDLSMSFLPERMAFDEVRRLEGDLGDMFYEEGGEVDEIVLIDSDRLEIEPDDWVSGYLSVKIGTEATSRDQMLAFVFEWKYSGDDSFSRWFLPAELIAAAEEAAAPEERMTAERARQMALDSLMEEALAEESEE